MDNAVKASVLSAQNVGFRADIGLALGLPGRSRRVHARDGVEYAGGGGFKFASTLVSSLFGATPRDFIWFTFRLTTLAPALLGSRSR